MNQATINQAYLFLIFILNGILIGVIFDIFRILRKSFCTPNIVTYIEDSLFWLISAFIVLYSLFVFNNGEIRGYIFIGIICGIALYILFLSRFVVKISVKIILFLKKVVYSVLKVIIYPIRIILNKAKNVISFINNLIKKCQNLPKKQKKIKNKEGF